VKKALSHGESHLVDHPQFTHPRTLPLLHEDGDGQAIIVTLQHCIEMINEFLATKLPPNHNLWFQQDGAVPHMAVISMAVLSCFVSTAGAFSFR
jgi:hypothetical protein